MGILVMKPLGGGHLRKSPKKAFDFLRNLGMVDSICVGMKSPAEVEMNVSLMEDRTLSGEILSQIETIPRHLRINDTCLGCGACIETCAQGALSVDWSKADPSKGKQGQAIVDNDQCILCGYCAQACPQFSIRVV
jgi:ferredoxin